MQLITRYHEDAARGSDGGKAGGVERRPSSYYFHIARFWGYPQNEKISSDVKPTNGIERARYKENGDNMRINAEMAGI